MSHPAVKVHSLPPLPVLSPITTPIRALTAPEFVQPAKPIQSASKHAVSYTVTLVLSESGATALRDENGRNWLEDMETELEFVADDLDELAEQVATFGRAIHVRPSTPKTPGPNAQALKDAAALVIQIREQPCVFADRYLALTRAVEDLQGQAKRAADYAMASREEAARQLRELDAAHEMRLDALEKIVASYETIIRHQEWLAEQHGAD